MQYAVGRLDVQARVKSGVTIKDAGSGVSGAADENPQPVVVPAAGYTVTGVLIGGQKQVDWQFKPKGSEEFTIYDDKMTTATAATVGTYSAVNHTLALETAQGADASINVAVEFINTGNDFYGKDHKVIPSGSKFYLVAQLTPSAGSGYAAGTLDSVIKQDYTTVAKLTIDEDALSKAYNMIPDLRSPKLEFGLSVDLKWETGIEFEQDFN